MVSEKTEKMTQMQNSRIDTKAASKYTGLSYSMLTKLRCTGGGPKYYKLGERVVYSIPDLDRWIEDRAKRCTSER
jgi:predicted DNA-binding transcriptional regulator AlpA